MVGKRKRFQAMEKAIKIATAMSDEDFLQEYLSKYVYAFHLRTLGQADKLAESQQDRQVPGFQRGSIPKQMLSTV